MKILFYGAGVIGQIYAAKLHAAGMDVTLLARGANYTRLVRDGVNIHNLLTNERTHSAVPVTRQLDMDDHHDLVIVTVRLDQLAGVKQSLAAHKGCAALLFIK